MNNLRLDAEKSPVSHIAIVVLLAIGLVSLPINLIFQTFISDPITVRLLSGTLIRVLLSIFVFIFIKKYSFARQITLRFRLSSLIYVLPAILVVINNIPIIALIKGEVVLVGSQFQLFLFIVYCIAVGVFEEAVFRGIIFPLCFIIFNNKKHRVFLSILTCSLIFSLSHLINIFNGQNIWSVLLQVGYTFCIGAMCNICLCLTKNIFIPIILHIIYDIGGLMVGCGVFYGNQWNIATIIITSTLGVLTFIYMTYITFKIDSVEVQKLYY